MEGEDVNKREKIREDEKRESKCRIYEKHLGNPKELGKCCHSLGHLILCHGCWDIVNDHRSSGVWNLF